MCEAGPHLKTQHDIVMTATDLAEIEHIRSSSYTDTLPYLLASFHHPESQPAPRTMLSPVATQWSLPQAILVTSAIPRSSQTHPELEKTQNYRNTT